MSVFRFKVMLHGLFTTKEKLIFQLILSGVTTASLGGVYYFYYVCLFWSVCIQYNTIQ